VIGCGWSSVETPQPPKPMAATATSAAVVLVYRVMAQVARYRAIAIVWASPAITAAARPPNSQFRPAADEP
jgi:hypothetical protein